MWTTSSSNINIEVEIDKTVNSTNQKISTHYMTLKSGAHEEVLYLMNVDFAEYTIWVKASGTATGVIKTAMHRMMIKNSKT